MATFTAIQPVSMFYSAPDFSILTDQATTWTSNIVTFTATNGSLEIVGTGAFNNPGGEPSVGSLSGLTVMQIDPAPPHLAHPAYSITDIGQTFQAVMGALGQPGGHSPLQFLLGGDDVITGSDVANAVEDLRGFAGNDKIYALDGPDTLLGDGGNDQLYGGADDDYLTGGPGHDFLDGGAGSDYADYSAMKKSVVVMVAGATAVKVTVGGVHEDTIVNIENVIGGHAADRLTGDGHNNELVGWAGADVLSGRGGSDNLYGGAGADVLSGGAGGDVLDGAQGSDTLIGGKGSDLFEFTTPLGGNVDTIRDFAPKVDHIFLSSQVFFAAAFDPGGFFAVGAAHNAHGHIIYQPGTGDLLYDADGTGASAPVMFAHLAPHLAMTYHDFILV